MNLSRITPLLLTYNEEANISRALERLAWAERIIVVDSHSTDDTLEILRDHTNVEVFKRDFDNHRDQWNYGLEQINTRWVLTLDADYMLSDAFVEELRRLVPQSEGYYAPFEYCVFGQPLRTSLYPPRCALLRVEKGHYVLDGHTQRLKLDGEAATLDAPIYHDDRKSLGAWLDAQERYTKAEIAKYAEQAVPQLSFADRLRTMKLAPPLVFLYCLLGKGLILDGKPGWYYTLERTYAEILLALQLLDRELREGTDTPT